MEYSLKYTTVVIVFEILNTAETGFPLNSDVPKEFSWIERIQTYFREFRKGESAEDIEKSFPLNSDVSKEFSWIERIQSYFRKFTKEESAENIDNFSLYSIGYRNQNNEDFATAYSDTTGVAFMMDKFLDYFGWSPIKEPPPPPKEETFFEKAENYLLCWRSSFYTMGADISTLLKEKKRNYLDMFEISQISYQECIYLLIFIISLLVLCYSCRKLYKNYKNNEKCFASDKPPPITTIALLQKKRSRLTQRNPMMLEVQETPGHISVWQAWKTVSVYLFVLSAILSLPWEFVRLYQSEVAKKAASTIAGMPPECMPHRMSYWAALKTWVVWQFSWNHIPCEKYHHALLVDPVWEVTPMMVLSSAFTRCIMKPFELIFMTIGNSLKCLLSEIPSPWQPIVMATCVIMTLTLAIMTCSYKITLPPFFKLEPHLRTPDHKRLQTSQCCQKVEPVKRSAKNFNLLH